jgi:hypothetical protein
MFTTFVVATLWLHLWSHCRYFDFISKPVSLTYFQFTLLYVANYNFLRYETIACYLFSYSWATPNWLLIIWHIVLSFMWKLVYLLKWLCREYKLAIYVWVHPDAVIFFLFSEKFALSSYRGETILLKGGEGSVEDH